MRSGRDRRGGGAVLPILLLASALTVMRVSADPLQGTPAPAGNPAYHYCPICGAQNRAENRFCLKDGTPLPPIDPGRRSTGFVRSPGTYSEMK